MPKSLIRENTHTEIDTETGEFKRIITEDFKGYVDTEPEYIKIYIGTQLCINSLDPNLAPLIIAFSPFMTYANDSHYTHMIMTNNTVFDYVAKKLSVSPGRAKQFVRKLTDAGIFIPIFVREEKNGVITQKRRRGQYFVNPWVVAKGSWKDIKKLRQNIDFISGASSYCIEDELGERKINCALPNSYRQMELKDYMEVEAIESKTNSDTRNTDE